jgi:hypothetical protein
LVENVTLSSLHVPVTLIYKGNFSNKFGYQLEAGVLYNLQFTGTMGSYKNANFNYEAVYNYQASPKNEPQTGSPDLGSNTSFNITIDQAAKAQYPTQGVAYLNLMGQNYPVGGNKVPQASNSTATFASGSIGFLARAGVTYYVNPAFAINVMAYLQSSSYNNNYANYQLITPFWAGPKYAQPQYYTTLLNGLSQLTATQVGLRVGITHALFYNVGQWKAKADGLATNLDAEHRKYHVIEKDLMDVNQRWEAMKKGNTCVKPEFMK